MDRPRDDFGPYLSWARDFALIGAATAAVPAMLGDLAIAGSALTVSSIVLTATLGLGVGLLVRTAVDHPFLRRFPLVVLVTAAAGLGALWCGGAATAATHLAGVHASPSCWASFWVGATAGMLQLGWLFLPYTWLRLRGCGSRTVVALALAVAPLLGAAAYATQG